MWEKKVDISSDEASDNDEIEDMQILDKIFEIINKKIDVTIDSNTKIFDN